MSDNLELYDDKIRSIESIEFNIWGNEEIRRVSALGKDNYGIEIPDLYDNMEPKRGGLIDTRLGVTSNSLECSTCGFDSKNCIGHFGHIELHDYMFHYGYLQFLKKILSCICLKCSKLLISKNDDEILELLKNKTGKARFVEVHKTIKNVTYCAKPGYGCGTPVTKIKIEPKKALCTTLLTSELHVMENDEEGVAQDDTADSAPTFKKDDFKKKIIRQVLTPEICYDILKNISDSDCMILGIDPSKSRPEYMIHKIFPVSPVAIRPSAKVDFLESSSKEDDLTHKLSDIVKANIRIKKIKEQSTDKSKYSQDNNLHILQFHIFTNYDNDSTVIPKSMQRTKQTKSVSERIKGKEGRIRGNLMGKRVDFCARTVITSDPTISMKQLRVPRKVSMTLTIPEIVTPLNIEHLTMLVKNGRDKYPGANFVEPFLSDGQYGYKIDLRYRKDKIELKYGDKVLRQIVNSDPVLLNRQPSLHKLSMMGHRITIPPSDKLNTFGLSVCVTTPYNADFDGDEMNFFLPQSIQARIELEEIANVENQIITPALSVPIIGIVQDGIIGSYVISMAGTTIDWKSAMNLIASTSIEDFSMFEKDIDYKGIDVFSMIIPNKINIVGNLTIENGKITKGILGDGALGAKKPNSIIRYVWDEYGPDKTHKFLDDTQFLINKFNMYNGFSTGIGDIDVSKETAKQVHIAIETSKLEIDHLITESENNPDLLDQDLLENTIIGKLQTTDGNVGNVVMNNLDSNNNFNIMITSGSKGNKGNMSQMGGCIGLQMVEGKRPLKKFNKRALSYFVQNDDSAVGRGYIPQPFYLGSKPTQFIFHNMASREGLIDTAIKTAESGYVQRKLVKFNEDVSVKYDNTVRNAKNSIVQFVYGDNGINTIKQSSHLLTLLGMTNTQISDKIRFTPEELKSNNLNLSINDNDLYYKNVLKLRNSIRKARLVSSLNNITFDQFFMLPVNIKSIIYNTKNATKYIKSNTKLTPSYIIEQIEEILSYTKTKTSCINKRSLKNDSLKSKDEMMTKTIFKMALYEFLSPKICIIEHKLTKEKFDRIVKIIIRKYNRAVVDPGEMVGVIAAQSIGEPVTQLTLNSVEYNTQMICQIDGKLVKTSFGSWIDALLEDHKDSIVNLEENQTEYLEIPETYGKVTIPTVDEHGKVSWGQITAITRHLPVGDLVKIKTESGREAIATRSKSFLIWDKEKKQFNQTFGADVKIGDCVPVTVNLPSHEDRWEGSADMIGQTVKCDTIDDVEKVVYICSQLSLYTRIIKCDPGVIEPATNFNVLIEDVKDSDKYELVNDILLDKICSIEDYQSAYPKVYDLTVPSTTNFCIANGLGMADTFHFTGKKSSASLGVGRVKELLGLSRSIKTPVMSIELEAKYKTDEKIANKIASTLKYTTLKDVRNKVDVYYDPNPQKKGGFMDIDRVHAPYYSHSQSKNKCQSDINSLPWLIRIDMNREIMLEKDISLLDIKSKFCNNWEKRYETLKKLKKDEREILEKVTQTSVLSNSENSKNPIIHIRFDISEVSFSVISSFIEIFVDNFKLKGVKNINKIFDVSDQNLVTFDKKTGEIVNIKQYVISTVGINLKKIRYINGIDLNSTSSNDLMLIYETYGIDTFRAAFIKEFSKIFANDGGRVNYHHLSILADSMTYNGIPISVDRHGVNKSDIDPLSRASFERPVDQLITASVFGEKDHMESVSARIMAGLVIKGGTGLVNVILDSELLESSEYLEDAQSAYTSFNEIKVDNVMNDIINKDTEYAAIFMPD